MTIVNEITKIENLFNLFNQRYYNNELHKPVITYSADDARKNIGWCTTQKVWYNGNDTNYEINISSNMVKYNNGGVYEVLLHEMAHLYAIEKGIKDISNNGFYHNKKYKEIAENHGLVCKCHKTYGWTLTYLSDDTKEFVKSLENLEMYYINPEKEKVNNTLEEEEEKEEEKKERVKRTFVYRCPVCGEEIKSKNPDGTYYDDCGEKFERVED